MNYEYSSNQVKISGVSLTDGYLILADSFYPGWECRINGKQTPVYRAYSYFRAVPVEAGDFNAVFTYNPISFKIGLLITCFGLVAWFLLGIVSLTYKASHKSRESSNNRQFERWHQGFRKIRSEHRFLEFYFPHSPSNLKSKSSLNQWMILHG